MKAIVAIFILTSFHTSSFNYFALSIHSPLFPFYSTFQTRTASQIRSHAQKYFEKLKYQNRCDEELSMVGNPTEKDAMMVLDYIENTLDKLKRKRDDQVNLLQREKAVNENGFGEIETNGDGIMEEARREED